MAIDFKSSPKWPPISILTLFRATIFAIIVALITTTTPNSVSAKEILFINPGHADRGFWKAVSETMRAASDHFGFDLKIVSAERKWPVMISEGIKAINSENPDYVIIVNEHQQAPTLLDATKAKGIPTLMLLNDLTDAQKEVHGQPRGYYPNWIGTLTPDNEIAGYEMAKSIIEKAAQASSRPIKLLTLAGDFKTPASLHRLAGLDRALAESKHPVDEVRRLVVNWSEREAYERTLRLLHSERVNAVWAANDPIAFGATRALRERGLEPGRDVSVVGLNWSGAAIDAVIKEEFTLTHGGHFLAGAWAVVLINDFDKGVDFSNHGLSISFPMSAINRDNAKAYKSVFGDQDWSKIDFSAFSHYRHNNADGYNFTLPQILENTR